MKHIFDISAFSVSSCCICMRLGVSVTDRCPIGTAISKHQEYALAYNTIYADIHIPMMT